MAKRIYVRLFINVIKWIFWMSLVCGIVIFFTVNSSKEFSQEQSNTSADKFPSSENVVNLEKLPPSEKVVNSDKLQSSENFVNSDKLPSSKNDVNSNKVPASENVVNSDKLQSSKNDVNQDKLPSSKNDVNRDKLPSSANDVNRDKLPSSANDVNSEKIQPHKNVNTDILQSQKNENDKHIMTSSKVCPEISFPSETVVDEGWQPVDNSRMMYTYSAYYVDDSRMVFVIGVRPQNQVTVICQLWHRIEGKTPELMSEAEADVRALLDDRGHRYAPTIFECFSDSSSPPNYVSLVIKNCDTPTNVLQIRSATKELPYKRPLTVCAPPLRLHYDNTKEFVRWIEFNKLLGVDKFVLYNYSSGPKIARVLDHYSELGLTEVVQWRPPMVAEGLPQEVRLIEIAKYGEIVALNDCLFRNKKDSEFISTVGINEFIIPHTNNETTLTDMIRALDNKGPAYHIRMAFSKRNHTGLGQAHRKKDTGPPLEKNQDLQYFEKVMPLSKLIIRTSDVDFTLVNTVPGVNTVPVQHDKLLMHRYPGGGHRQKLGLHIDDVLPEKLVNKAKTNVQNVWNKVPDAIGDELMA